MTQKNILRFTENESFLNEIKLLHENFNHYQTLLFIEPYGAVLSLLKRALSKAFNVIVLTANTDLRIVPQSFLSSVTLTILIDTANDEEVIHFVEQTRTVLVIDGVIPGFEYFVPIASKISHLLNKPGVPVQDVMKVRRKDLMRLALQSSRCVIPQFCIVHSLDELQNAIKKIKFPAICKPIDAAGSVNVKKVNNQLEALEAATRILEGADILWGHPLARRLLVEEYIDGKEFSLEGVVRNGKIIHFSMTEKFVSDQIEFIEIGHVVNTKMDNALKNRVERYVENVIKILNMDHCPFHAEVRIQSDGQPVLMEIAARLAGDKIGDLINLSKDINYFDAILATYLGVGETISVNKANDAYAGIRFFYRPYVDTYTKVIGLDNAVEFPIEEVSLYYHPNQCIPSFPKPLRRLGHVMMKSHDYDYLVNTLNKIDGLIQFCSEQ